MPNLPSLVAHRPRVVLLAALFLSLLALWPASRLEVVTDLASVLPNDEPASEDYRIYLRLFGGIENIIISVRAAGEPTPEPEELAAAAQVLTEALAESPLVESIRSGILSQDEEQLLDLLRAGSLLLLELEDPEVEERFHRSLEAEAIRDRVALMRQRLLGPSGSLLSDLFSVDPLGLLTLTRTGGLDLPTDPFTGAFLASNQNAALVIVTPARGEIDAAAGRAIEDALESAYARTRAATGLGLEFFAVGGPLYAAHDERTIRSDLIWTGTGSVVIVTIVLLLAFGGAGMPLVMIVTVGFGLLWTTAIVGGSISRLSAVAIGFAAILLGLGVDYVIHGGTRFLEARGAGSNVDLSIALSFRETGPGIVASAITTAVGFGCLAFAHFRPLREMGLFVAIGILAVLLSTATVGASLVSLLARRQGGQGRGPLWAGLGSGVERLSAIPGRHPKAVLLFAGLLTVGAVAGGRSLSLDSSPQRLRPESHPIVEAEQALLEDFPIAMDTSTVVVQAGNLSDALNRAATVAAVLRHFPGAEADVQSPSDWLVGGERARARMAVLQRHDLAAAIGILERELQATGFDLQAFDGTLEVLRGLAHGETPEPLPRSSWPQWLADSIRDDVDGVAMAVRLRLIADGGPPAALVEAVLSSGPEVSFASIPRVGEELRVLALDDLTRLGGLALLLLFLSMVATFRGNVVHALVAGIPVLLGSAWTFGLWGALGRPIDLFCLAFLPVMLGIGVDDGLHVVHRIRGRLSGNLGEAVRRTGRAMALTSLTTAAGFASLVFSSIPGLRNGGLLVAVGVLACLLATLLVLPGIDAWLKSTSRT